MTDISTQHSLSFSAAPVRGLRLPAILAKIFVRSRCTNQIDPRYATEHLLKDIGIRRSYDIPPSSSFGKLW